MTSWRRDRIVFVDPDDDQLSYWWPALIVPFEEISIFKETMGAEIDDILSGEQLVCYFEDGSYSIVREQDLLSFCPGEEPYQTYIRSSFAKSFLQDRAVILASKYWESGEVPDSFKWLPATYSDAKVRKRKESLAKQQQQQQQVAAES